ncbi:unnamed protein product [Cyprideis torosa]|uniref:Galactosylgalactosylxylosylprotein 3-beta-glucuronosyltransferase n=1 Tax=Cyprideis torosa TaxID=163714 RepID=A0A7R8WI97_9CRUS|nr:unnamed protein product [Cyprideis torosa]CAG0900458.1 unnamed protein product [Cyprideis torosa]
MVHWQWFLRRRQLFYGTCCVLILYLIHGALIDSAQEDSQVDLRKELIFLRKQGFFQSKDPGASNAQIPTVFLIMPTYKRPTQIPDLIRQCHTFLAVPSFVWILVEDAPERSDVVSNFLRRCGVPSIHLNAATPEKLKIKTQQRKRPRGNFHGTKCRRHFRFSFFVCVRRIEQRNEGLRWIRENTKGIAGVVYFGDDDNTYEHQLFEEMRDTKRVSVWPVGIAGGVMVEGPIVDPSTGKILKFNAAYKPSRKFPVDMAAFAINARLFHEKPEALFDIPKRDGELEGEILKYFLDSPFDMEPKADFATKILVWHTRTSSAVLTQEKKLKEPSDSHIKYVWT